MKPMLKWPGGKRRLLPEIKQRLPQGYKDRVYVEPFFGGGALFFDLEPAGALLLDANKALMKTYAFTRDKAPKLIRVLKREYLNRNNESSYYLVRERYNRRAGFGVEQAAQFIYLNKTCFNGLFRVNSSGEFNVPFGSYERPAVCEPHVLLSAQRALRQARLYAGDFTALLGLCEGDEFVYLDPPYFAEAKSGAPGFTSYVPGGFGAQAHRHLARVYRALDARGCALMLSHADTPYIRQLYEGYRIESVSCKRSIAADKDSRGDAQEVLIRNYS